MHRPLFALGLILLGLGGLRGLAAPRTMAQAGPMQGTPTTTATLSSTPSATPRSNVCPYLFQEDFNQGTLGAFDSIGWQVRHGSNYFAWARVPDPPLTCVPPDAPLPLITPTKPDLNASPLYYASLTQRDPITIPSDAQEVRLDYNEGVTCGLGYCSLQADISVNGGVWQPTGPDLLPYRGQTVRLRFTAGYSPIEPDCGAFGEYWLDNIVITYYAPGCPPRPSSTPTWTPTITPTFTPHPGQFEDVPPIYPFYSYIECMGARQIIGGYGCGGPGEPCLPPGNRPYFRPGNNLTRGQAAKIVSTAAGFAEPIPSGQQTFEDVPPSSPFWLWIERLAGRGIISGYGCGGSGEPCVPPGNRPYFRPGLGVTRGQLSKIDANAADYQETIPTTQQTFADVPPAQPFWLWVERVAGRGIISGYACGGPGEPCDPLGRPYFRPGNDVTRGQTAKIGTNTFSPGCQDRTPTSTPFPTPTLIATGTPTAIVTEMPTETPSETETPTATPTP